MVRNKRKSHTRMEQEGDGMSSVFIKDIFGKERPMPQEGYIDVRLHFRGGRIECATMQTGNRPFYATLKTVEIPTPHGRLIDADKLARETIYNPSSAPYITEQMLLDAPTVIEAEGERNEICIEYCGNNKTFS